MVRENTLSEWSMPLVFVALVISATACAPGEEVPDGAATGEAMGTAASPVADSGPPAAPGSADAPALHALGQEPGWIVDVVPGGDLRVLAQYATDTIIAPAPTPTRRPDGATIYRASTDGREVTVIVTDEPCRDAMSGKPFPMTVTLELDGQTFVGCGERGGGQ